MKITINGNEEILLSETTLKEILSEKNFDLPGIIVVYNGNVLPKEEWSKIALQENDDIEILRFLGGG